MQPIAAVHKASSSTPTGFQNKSNYFFRAILFFGCFDTELYFGSLQIASFFKLYLETALEETLFKKGSLELQAFIVREQEHKHFSTR